MNEGNDSFPIDSEEHHRRLTEDNSRKFWQRWKEVSGLVWAECRRVARSNNPHSSVAAEADAVEIEERILFILYNTFTSWRGDSSFKNWVYPIIQRAIVDYYTKRIREGDKRIRVSGQIKLTSLPAPQIDKDGEPTTWEGQTDWISFDAGHNSGIDPARYRFELYQTIQAVIDGALKLNFITTLQARIFTLRAHLKDDGKNEYSHEEIAAKLGIDIAACRAEIPSAKQNLRRYIFLHEQELLGGKSSLALILKQMLDCIPPKLSVAEAFMFKNWILDDLRTYQPKGWKSILQATCDKTAEENPKIISALL